MIPVDNDCILELRRQGQNCPCIEKITNTLSYEDFFKQYLLTNRPCILSSEFTNSWRSRKEWCKDDGSPDFEFIQKYFGML